MKFSNKISSQTRVNRKKYHIADSNRRRVLMSSRIEKNFRKNYNIKTIPLRKGDEVKIMRGAQKGKIGKIVQSSRKRMIIYISNATYKKKNGEDAYQPIHPSNVQVQKLILTTERKQKIKA